VRTLLAVLTALVLVTAVTADLVACVDGCTDDEQHETSTVASACALCHAWVAPVAPGMGTPHDAPVVRTTPVTADERSPHLVPIEHPPRTH